MKLLNFIPKQVHVPYLGALFDLNSKALALAGGFSFLMLTRNTYYDSDDCLLRDIFGSYILFMIAIMLGYFIVLIILYVFLVPSTNSYAQKQAVIEGRSPMFEKLCEVEERLKEIEKRL